MKHLKRLLAVLLGCVSVIAHAQSLPTSFAYEGTLYVSENLATGSFDFHVSLFDSASESGPGHKIGQSADFLQTGVTNGSFSLRLDFGPAAFTNAARWLEIEVRRDSSTAWSTLTPRQAVHPVPIALFALSGGTPGPPGKDGTNAAPGGAFDGRLGLFRMGVDWDIFDYETIGIFKTPNNPGSNLRLRSPQDIFFHPLDSTRESAAIRADGADFNNIGLHANGASATISYPKRVHLQSGELLYLNPFKNELAESAVVVGNDDNRVNLIVHGQTTGDSYHVRGGGQLNGDQGGSLELGSRSGSGTTVPYIDLNYGGSPYDYSIRLHNNAEDRLMISSLNGRGEPIPAHLDVQGRLTLNGDISMPVESEIKLGHGAFGNGQFIELKSDGGVQFIDFSNNLDADYDARIIHVSDGVLKVFATRFEVPTLGITGGADIAERYDSTFSNGELRPGTVVRYASDGSQKIELCNKEADPAVAGVITAAGGVKSGLVLEQTGTLASGEHTVALLGRVQVWADASFGEIEVGDSLVSSSNPGYAMAAENPREAVGAIIGKATSPLKSGTGLIWMHVSLK